MILDRRLKKKKKKRRISGNTYFATVINFFWQTKQYPSYTCTRKLAFCATSLSGVLRYVALAHARTLPRSRVQASSSVVCVSDNFDCVLRSQLQFDSPHGSDLPRKLISIRSCLASRRANLLSIAILSVAEFVVS